MLGRFPSSLFHDCMLVNMYCERGNLSYSCFSFYENFRVWTLTCCHCWQILWFHCYYLLYQDYDERVMFGSSPVEFGLLHVLDIMWNLEAWGYILLRPHNGQQRSCINNWGIPSNWGLICRKWSYNISPNRGVPAKEILLPKQSDVLEGSKSVSSEQGDHT
jgi:hypothetical protein